jgi:hypothetical protein
MADVIDFPEQEESNNIPDDFPIQYYGYIDSVATGVFGDMIGFNLSPAQTEEGENVVVMIVGSLKYENIVRKAIFDLKDLSEVRKACLVIAYEILVLEVEYEKTAGGKLIVPKEQGLIIPGR